MRKSEGKFHVNIFMDMETQLLAFLSLTPSPPMDAQFKRLCDVPSSSKVNSQQRLLTQCGLSPVHREQEEDPAVYGR